MERSLQATFGSLGVVQSAEMFDGAEGCLGLLYSGFGLAL